MSDERPLHDHVQREALIRKLRNLVALTQGQRLAIADGWEREAVKRAALEADNARFREALENIAGNALQDNACWCARAALGRFDFADLPTAPEWYRKLAEEASNGD